MGDEPWPYDEPSKEDEEAERHNASFGYDKDPLRVTPPDTLAFACGCKIPHIAEGPYQIHMCEHHAMLTTDAKEQDAFEKLKKRVVALRLLIEQDQDDKALKMKGYIVEAAIDFVHIVEENNG